MSRYPFETVEIDGFRGLRNFKMSRLGGVNVLVGGNNCGKTSVLEAISVLCNPRVPGTWMSVIRWRDPGGMDESRLESLRWCFQNAGTDSNELARGHCTFKTEGKSALRKLEVEFQEFSGEPSKQELLHLAGMVNWSDLEQSGRLWHGGSLVHRVHSQWLGGEEVDLGGFPFQFWENLPIQTPPTDKFGLLGLFESVPSKVLSAYSYQLNSEQVKSLSLVSGGDDATQVVELLQQFDPDVTAVDIRSTRGLRPAIYLSHRRLGQVPLSIFGDAMRRSVLLASTLSALKPGSVLLIDEAEAGVHVGAQARFFAWLIKVAKQKQVQVFMTTHSLEALDALLTGLPADAADDDLVVYQLHRHGEELDCKRFAGDLLHRLRFERGLDLR